MFKITISKLFLFLSVIALMAIVSLLGFAVGDYLYYRDKIVPGYYVAKIDVGGLTPAQAIKLLKNKPVNEFFDSPFILYLGKSEFEFNSSDIGVELNIEKAVLDCYRLSYSKNYFDYVLFRIFGKRIVVVTDISYSGENLLNLVKFVSDELNSRPVSARYILNKRGIVSVLPSKDGFEIDIWRTYAEIDKALRNNINRIPVIAKSSRPMATTEALKKYLPLYLIGKFQTFYGSHDSPNRIHNIQLIASFLDNIIVKPAESFSLLSHIGDFTEERGFKEAYVIVDGVLEAQYGGGTCQIATTLFNAVSFAGLNVTSRRNHSMWFSIYPLGRDATVYPPYSDFKFINDTGHNIVINPIATKKSLTFNILGTPTGKKVSFSSPGIKYFYSYATDEATGEYKKVRLKPFKTTVVMTVKKKGKIIAEKVYKSFYKLNGDRDTVVIKKREKF